MEKNAIYSQNGDDKNFNEVFVCFLFELRPLIQ